MSSMHDGEQPSVDRTAIDAHLRRCDDCRAWQQAVLTATTRITQTDLGPTGDVTDKVLLILASEGHGDRASTGWVRLALCVVGVLMPLLSLHDVMASRAGEEHIALELGSFEVALAVGFVAAALRPARTWGMLPLVAFAVVATVLVNLGEMLGGGMTLQEGTNHLPELVGLALMWRLRATFQWPPRHELA